MLDIGFTELLLVAIIALVVLGPERLPQVIKAGVYWIGKFRRGFQSIQSELEREVGIDEIKRQIYNEEVMKKLDESSDQLRSEAGGVVSSADQRSASAPKHVSVDSDVDLTNNLQCEEDSKDKLQAKDKP